MVDRQTISEQKPLHQRHLTGREMLEAATFGVFVGVTGGALGEVGRIGAQAALPVVGEVLTETKKVLDIFPTLRDATAFFNNFDQYAKEIISLWMQQGKIVIEGVGAATGISSALAHLDRQLLLKHQADKKAHRGAVPQVQPVSQTGNGKENRYQHKRRVLMQKGIDERDNILRKTAEESPETALAYRVIQQLPQRIRELGWSGSGVEWAGANAGSLVSRYLSPDAIERIGALVKNLKDPVSGNEFFEKLPDSDMEELLMRIALVDMYRDGKAVNSALIFRGNEPAAWQQESWKWIKSLVMVTDEKRPMAVLMSESGDLMRTRRDEASMRQSYFKNVLTIGEPTDHSGVSPNVGVYGPDRKQHSLLSALKQAVILQRVRR